MTQEDGSSGKRGLNPPPIISHAPKGFAGAPARSDAEQQRAVYLAIGAPFAVAFLLLLLILWAEQVRCTSGDTTDSADETRCSSHSGSSGGGGGGGGGGEGRASFGGFGGFGGWHGGGG